MKRRVIEAAMSGVLAVAATVMMTACATENPPTQPAGQTAAQPAADAAQPAAQRAAAPSREEELLLSITGTIVDIDHAKRDVTLKGPFGNVETFSVGPQVKRLNEAQVGDNVRLDYYVGVVAELRKPTPEEASSPLMMLEDTGRAPSSTAPAGAEVRRLKAVCTIEAMNRPARTITVKGPRGRHYTARVADPANLTQMRIGDTIVVSLTEAAVVSLEKVPARP
jgi:hypothetical protein